MRQDFRTLWLVMHFSIHSLSMKEAPVFPFGGRRTLLLLLSLMSLPFAARHGAMLARELLVQLFAVPCRVGRRKHRLERHGRDAHPAK